MSTECILRRQPAVITVAVPAEPWTLQENLDLGLIPALSLLTLLKKNNQTTNDIKNSKPIPPHFLFWKRLTRKEVYWALWQPHSCCGAPSIHAKSHISFSLLSSRQEGARQAPSFLPLLSLEDIPTPPSPQLGTAQSKGLWLKEARLKA